MKEKNISDSHLQLPCIVCDKKLAPAFPGTTAPTQPLHALNFVGHGAYGSEFDPMDGRLTLTINVCDGCLANKGNEGSVLMVTQERPVLPEPVFTPYRQDKEED